MASVHLSPSAEYLSLLSTKTAIETAKGDRWRSCTLVCKENSASYMTLANIIYVKLKMPLPKIKLSSSHALLCSSPEEASHRKIS